MSDASATKAVAITIEKTERAIVARARVKILDDEALKTLARQIDEASADGLTVPLVVIDLSGVGVVPSLALGLLVQIASKCRARQQKLMLAGVPAPVRQVFSITRLDRLFQFAESVSAAIE